MPTLSGLTGSISFREDTVNAAAQIIDASVTFIDVENDFNGGQLIVSGLLAEDRIGIYDQGTGPGQIGVSGSAISYGGTVIGSFTGGSGGNLVVTFNANATDTAVDALIQCLTYADVSDAPTAQRTLSLDVIDAAGNHLSGGAQPLTIEVVAVNDAPVAVPPDPMVTTEGVSFVVTGFSISDPDADPAVDGFAAKLIIEGGPGVIAIRDDVPGGIEAGQIIGNNGDAVFFASGTTLDQFNATFSAVNGIVVTPGSGFTGTLQLRLGVSDLGNHGLDPGGEPNAEGIDVWYDITVTALNHAPQGVDSSVNATEDTDYVFAASDFVFTDDNDDDLLGVTIVGGATAGTLYLDSDGPGGAGPAVFAGGFVSRAQLDAGGLTFVAGPDANGAGFATFGFKVQDDGGTTSGGVDTDATANTLTINVAAVNDAPVLTGPKTPTITVTPFGPPVALMGGAAADDVDFEGDWQGAGFTLGVSGTSGSIILAAGSDFEVSGASIVRISTGDTIGEVAGLGTRSVTVSGMTADATGETLDLLLQAFAFDILAQAPSTRTVTLTFSDGGNGGAPALDDSVTQTLVIPYNIVTGTPGSDTLAGTDWADEIVGRGAGDTLTSAGPGADRLYGGRGDDQYVIGARGVLAIERAGEGTDTVHASVSYDLAGQQIEILELTGSGELDGYGNSLDNRLIGNTGYNVLTGRGGNDSYVVQNSYDRVIERDGEGHDTVESSVNYSLAGQCIEDLVLTGAASTKGSGNSLDNAITGNGGDNVLNGAGGDDMLDGGAGADLMAGGTGDDRYRVDDAGDRVRESAGEGYDTVVATVSFALIGQHIEALVLEGSDAIDGRGNSLANIITGNDGANWLRGEGGDDVLDGGAGADRLSGGDGSDIFAFTHALGDGNVDAILDFTSGVDTIRLEGTLFPALGSSVDAGELRLGTAALDADDRLIYDMATGNLWYDGDGSGDGAAVLFATLAPGTALGFADLAVVATG